VDRVAVLGSSERNLKMLREAVGVAVTSRDGVVRLNGDRLQVSAARRVLERLIEADRRGRRSGRGGGVGRGEEGGDGGGEGSGRGGARRGAGSADGFRAGADSVTQGHPDYSTRQGVLDLIGATLREVTREDEQHAANHGGSGGAVGRDADGWADSALGADEGEPGGDGPWSEVLNVYVSGRPVEPRTENQRRYLDAIRENEVVFGIGPAGTGKTYLAVAAAVHML
jgi:phosphate starvation-inducible PhoH-like protein